MTTIDYSKWKNIEISDDEDDTHPNIDTPSLFRWRHKARIERMEEEEREKEDFKKARQSCQARLIDVKERIQSAESETDKEVLNKDLQKLEIENKELDRREEELKKREKKTPWNVDTISKPGFAKTVLNKAAVRKPEENLTEEEREERLRQFIKENEKLCKEYGMLQKYNDSKRFLQQHLHLACDDTANYLVVWSINLEMEEKHELMAHVAHQTICMQYILELAKQLDVDPRSCVSSFFEKIQNCVPEYREQFEKEIEGFKDRVRKRAAEKIKDAMKAAEEEEEEHQNTIGPGGLDPADVFETLPEALQKCFESRDIELLQKTIAEMPVEDAKYHMKRCVDSGLWVPNPGDEPLTKDIDADEGGKDTENNKEGAGVESGTSTAKTDDKEKAKEEPIYTGVSTEDVD